MEICSSVEITSVIHKATKGVLDDGQLIQKLFIPGVFVLFNWTAFFLNVVYIPYWGLKNLGYQFSYVKFY